MVAEGAFREDLYYRLYVVPIEIPPLRKRREDILPLIRFFLDKFNRKYQTAKSLTEATLKSLEEYQWPGNVRELANLVERLVVTTPSHEIRPEHLPPLTGGNLAASEAATRVEEHRKASSEPESAVALWEERRLFSVKFANGTDQQRDEEAQRQWPLTSVVELVRLGELKN